MIKPCSEKKFLRNLQELNDYFVSRKRIKVITNTDRLINILKVYFESLLCYQRIHIGNNYIRIKGKTYLSEIHGHDKGVPSTKGLDEIGESLIRDVLYDLKFTLNKDSLLDYILTSNDILDSKNIDIEYKIQLLNSEGKTFDKSWQYLLFDLEEHVAIKSINKRKEFVLKILTEDNNYFNTQDSNEEKLSSIYTSYGFLIRAAVRVFIYHNHFDKIFNYLYQEFELFHSIPEEIELDDNKIITILLRQLITNNKLFLIEKDEVVEGYFHDNYNLLSEESKSQFRSDFDFDIKDVELKDSSVELAQPNFEQVDRNNIITTITFILPGYIIDKESIISVRENIGIEFKNVRNLFDDPVFSFLDSLDIAINSFPFTIFSDAIGNTNNSVKISIIINGLYNPDFKIVESGIEKISFADKEALLGRTYYPHKEFAVELLRDLKVNKSEIFPINIELEKININLISNYYVSYSDTNQHLIYNKIYTITNIDSYIKIKNRFLTKIEKLNLTDEVNDIRTLIIETNITSLKELNDFMLKLIQITVKKSIELRGINKIFWNNKTPIKETKAQPIIFNLIKSISEIKGIQVSKEIEAANGSLDIHCSYTHDGKLLTSCIELKNAHHPNIIHGINSQLPSYIADEGNHYGIFLVLWYKNDQFLKPAAYDTIETLKNELKKEIPKKLRIEVEIIDCTIKPTPAVKK